MCVSKCRFRPKISILVRWIKPSALFHHVTNNLLEHPFDGLKNDAASGVDGSALFNILDLFRELAREASAPPLPLHSSASAKYPQYARHNFLVSEPVTQVASSSLPLGELDARTVQFVRENRHCSRD
jgi:hypothetical protein